MDALDIAHPALTLVLVIALLVVLGLLQNVARRLSLCEHRLATIETEQRLYDDALAVVSHSPAPLPADDDARGLREQIADMQRGENPDG